MSVLEYVGSNGRTYQRRFDHDDCLRRYQGGETVIALASEYGVTTKAIYRVVTPGAKARYAARGKVWRTGECELCGGPAMRLIGSKVSHNPDGRVLCLACRGRERRECVRFDEDWTLVAVKCCSVDCANGERWQAPAEFCRGKRYPDLREGGFHGLCRQCQSRGRRQLRDRKKQPCTRCGRPCLPAGEKGRRGRDTGLCQPCYQASRKPEAVTSEAASPLKEKASSDA